jgi:CheY-like chemotaxis protein
VNSRRSLLLVDDCEAELELMGHYLEAWQDRVAFALARNGRDAADFVLRRGHYAAGPAAPAALVIIDNKMPVMGGIEAVREMRAAPAHRQLPIVMWSGSADPGDLRRAYDAGVTSYLLKPSGSQQAREMLQATVRYWIDLHHPAG